MKKIMFLLLVMIAAVPVLSQQAQTPAPQPAASTPATPPPATPAPTGTDTAEGQSDQVYSEIILEDFETTAYTSKNLMIDRFKDQQADIVIREEYPAPIKSSKKYLGVKEYGKAGDQLIIIPPKPIVIEDYCQSISIWVYGKNFAGELSLMVMDASGQAHRLSFGKLNFLGWRKLTVKLSRTIAQEDLYLSQPRKLSVIKILYNPGNTDRLPMWNYFYIDDISAKVRKKYKDRQSDTW